MENFRKKQVLVKVNHTTNPNWYHFEKRCYMQKEIDGEWIDVEEVYFLKDENGEERELSLDEFLSLSKKLK